MYIHQLFTCHSTYITCLQLIYKQWQHSACVFGTVPCVLVLFYVSKQIYVQLLTNNSSDKTAGFASPDVCHNSVISRVKHFTIKLVICSFMPPLQYSFSNMLRLCLLIETLKRYQFFPIVWFQIYFEDPYVSNIPILLRSGNPN